MKSIVCYTVIAVGACLLPVASQVVEKPVPGDPVLIDSGAISGKVLASGVKAYLGIPFAAPPVRELRWREPQPVKPWKGVYHADRMMPECMQVLRPHNINNYFGEEPTSEDCLYMNIWAPPSAKAGTKLPVIVFIYGGGGTIGSSGMANYDGEQVARRGAVFVNFNYRVGLLGFMAHPEVTKEQGGHSGNEGYLDQNAALKWVNRNIAKFGGDPAKVVMSGQSAGAGAVVQQMFSPLSKGLFRAAIMWSGCNWSRDNAPPATAAAGRGTPAGPGGRGASTLAAAEKTGLEIQKALKANNLDEIRQVAADRILTIQTESQLGVSVTGFRAGGVIDGYFSPKPQADILAAHEINDVPIIASFTHDEATIALKQAKTVDEYKATAAKLFGGAANEFLQLYPVSSAAEIPAVAQDAANDSAGLFNSCNCASLQATYNKSAAYITVFARKHPYTPGVKIADQDIASIGAYHAGEIPYFFGTLDAFNLFRSTRNWTPYDRDLSEKATAAIIAFANTGNPATSSVPWPAWSAQNPRYVSFGDKITIEKVNTARLDFMSKHRPAGSGMMAPRPGGGPLD
jgi:para-nitrobenzyl esterase